MKRMIIVILSMFSLSVYANNLEDSVYADMYYFVVNMEGSDFLAKHPRDNRYPYKESIEIYDVLDSVQASTRICMTKPFGVYEFWHVGLNRSFILIKDKDAFTVFKKQNILDIMDHLLLIKNRDPEMLTDEILLMCIQRLVKLINDDMTFGSKIGKLEYIFKTGDDFYK